MILSYGNYRHCNGEVAIVIDRQNMLNAAGIALSQEVRWSLQGMLVNQSGIAGNLAAQIVRLEQAYSVPGLDLVLYQPDGVTVSSHYLYSGSTLGGVRITKPVSYPEGSGPQGVTYRTYSIELAGMFALAAETGLVEFHEEIQSSGGGPARGLLEPLTGYPVEQLRKQNTIARATQQGRAVGFASYPAIPGPIWPQALIGTPNVTMGSPQRLGNNFINWPISWVYQYESAQPLNGRPNLWRG